VGGEVVSCYSGPTGSLGVGRCSSGVSACGAGGEARCEGEVLPALERCGAEAGVDEDCDGLVDEACDEDGDGVTVSEGDCDDARGDVFPGAADGCDGVDQDCDLEVDEDLAACYEGPAGTLGVGVCATGVSACFDGLQGRCGGQALPSQETCGGGADEDCDGRVDEGCGQVSCADLDLSTPLSVSATCLVPNSGAQVLVRLRPAALNGRPLPPNLALTLTSQPAAPISAPVQINGEWVWVLTAPATARVVLELSVSASCGAGAPQQYAARPTVSVGVLNQTPDTLAFSSCVGTQHHLIATALDLYTGAPVQGASVMVGDEPRSDLQPDPYAAVRGAPGAAPNYAFTDARGRAALQDFSGRLLGPVTVTVGAPGYENITVVGSDSPQVLVGLRPITPPATLYSAAGAASNFNQLGNDGDTDLALVMPSVTVRELSTLNVLQLLSRSQCWQPAPLLPQVEIPGNLYVPRQNDSVGLVPLLINEHSYSLRDAPRATDDLVALGGKISTSVAVDALRSGSASMADLLTQVTFGEIGVRRAQALTPAGSQVANVTISLSTDLSATASCRVSGAPAGAYATCFTAGVWPNQGATDDARAFPMGLVNIPAEELARGPATRALTVTPAAGDFTGISYVGAALALYGQDDPRRDAVSAIIRRAGLGAGGGALSFSGFLNATTLSQQGRAYSWTPVQTASSPVPHLCELEVRRVTTTTYSPGGCASNKTREAHTPLWRVFMVGDPGATSLPTLPAAWPRAAAGGLLSPAELASNERLRAQIRCQRFVPNFPLDFQNDSWGPLLVTHVSAHVIDITP